MGKLNKYLPKTRGGNFFAAVLMLLVAYILASRAIDTGSWWEYCGSWFLVILAIKGFIRAVRRENDYKR